MVSSNQVGSVQLVTDTDTGEVVQRMGYDSFGEVIFDSASGLQPFGFAGGLYDAATGLVRLGARDYSATVGRWTSTDRIRFVDQDNLSVYVENDPINRIDPLGLGWFSFIKCVYYNYKLEEDTKECKEIAKRDHANKPFDEYIQELCDNYGNGEPNQPRSPSLDHQKCNQKSQYYRKKLKACGDSARPVARIPR